VERKQVLHEQQVIEFIISISRPGKSWNLSEGHGKVICLILRINVKKITKS